MGSYLSIHNNTRDSYNVKVGIDEAAIRVLGILGIVLAGLSITLVTAGMAAPVWSVAMVTTGVAKVVGITAAQLAAITAIASVVAKVTIAADLAGLAIAFSVLLAQELEDQGFVPIKPGAQHKFGRYTLSLWRQGTCHRVRVDPNNRNQVLMDTVYMRPIFTGSTNNSTRVHNIQHWIDRWGHENEHAIELSADAINTSRSAMDEAVAQCEGIDWLQVFVKARQNAMQEMLQKEGIDPAVYN